MAQDTIQIEILPDGTIKVTTDAVSMPNHSSAERFMKDMEDMAGGKQTRERRGHGHHHHHEHHHDHAGH